MTSHYIIYKRMCYYIPGLWYNTRVYVRIYQVYVGIEAFMQIYTNYMTFGIIWHLWLHAKRRRPVNSHHIPWTHIIIPRNSHHIPYQPCIYQVCPFISWADLLCLVYASLWKYMSSYDGICEYMRVQNILTKCALLPDSNPEPHAHCEAV